MSTYYQRIASLLLLTGLTLSVTVAGAASITPEELIRKMSTALTELNYEGSFVLVQNNNVEAMSVVHSNAKGGELEYMLSLNGEAREVFRNQSEVTCIWPNSQSVIISESKSRQILPAVDESLANGELYQLSMDKPDRVAGVDTYVVDIKPRDEFRYGYRFWIDQQTFMLLRSSIIDQNDNPIEQVMFTNISYPESISADRFKTPNKQIEAYKTKLAQKPIVANSQTSNRVDFTKLPMGYEEVSETYQAMPINDGPVSHVMLSDGMVSVSVYVEYGTKPDQQDLVLGESSMGGMNAYTHSMPKALITVVGEVPPATVEAIAMSVRLISE